MKIKEFIDILQNEWLTNKHYVPRRKHMKILIDIIEKQNYFINIVKTVNSVFENRVQQTIHDEANKILEMDVFAVEENKESKYTNRLEEENEELKKRIAGMEELAATRIEIEELRGSVKGFIRHV